MAKSVCCVVLEIYVEMSFFLNICIMKISIFFQYKLPVKLQYKNIIIYEHRADLCLFKVIITQNIY